MLFGGGMVGESEFLVEVTLRIGLRLGFRGRFCSYMILISLFWLYYLFIDFLIGEVFSSIE